MLKWIKNLFRLRKGLIKEIESTQLSKEKLEEFKENYNKEVRDGTVKRGIMTGDGIEIIPNPR